MNRFLGSWIALSLLLAASYPAFASDYAVIVSKSTHADPDWNAVVQALADKHHAPVILYDHNVDETLPRLKQLFPRALGVVARPEDAGKDFVAQIHRLSRQLDHDPYADTSWGIITGYTPDAALRIVQVRQPLTIHNAASGTEIALEMCDQGLWFSELKKGHMVKKPPNGAPRPAKAPDDTTQALVDALNHADLFVTSGHATERDWQIGFGYRNGSFRCRDGRLYGLDTQGQEHPVDSSSPKVYLAVGNCLMGHIDGRDAMALAWMNSAGVVQMIGYTDLTWFGYAGWGCLDYFVEQPGRFTLSEAFLANQHALIHRLQTLPAQDRDVPGLTYDRDIVAFYGDPAWQARMAEHDKPWNQSLLESDGLYTFEITPRRGESSFQPINTNGSQRGGRPIIQFLPHRVQDVEIVEGSDLNPVITDDFLLVPNPGTCKPGQTYRVVFRARPLDH